MVAATRLPANCRACSSSLLSLRSVRPAKAQTPASRLQAYSGTPMKALYPWVGSSGDIRNVFPWSCRKREWGQGTVFPEHPAHQALAHREAAPPQGAHGRPLHRGHAVLLGPGQKLAQDAHAQAGVTAPGVEHLGVETARVLVAQGRVLRVVEQVQYAAVQGLPGAGGLDPDQALQEMGETLGPPSSPARRRRAGSWCPPPARRRRPPAWPRRPGFPRPARKGRWPWPPACTGPRPPAPRAWPRNPPRPRRPRWSGRP